MSQNSEVYDSVMEMFKHEAETGEFKPPVEESSTEMDTPTPRRPERHKRETKRRAATHNCH